MWTPRSRPASRWSTCRCRFPTCRSRPSCAAGAPMALDMVARVVGYARDKGLAVAVGGEDASRADVDFLVEVIAAAKAAGARRFRVADTLSVLDPYSTYALMRRCARPPTSRSRFHAHDDLGLATANTLAAVKAGATHASVTVIGLGERAGNAPLEEVAVALPQLYGRETGIVLYRTRQRRRRGRRRRGTGHPAQQGDRGRTCLHPRIGDPCRWPAEGPAHLPGARPDPVRPLAIVSSSASIPACRRSRAARKLAAAGERRTSCARFLPACASTRSPTKVRSRPRR